MLQLGLIVFLNEYTEPRSTEPIQVAPPKRLTPPGPSPLNSPPPPSLGNERKVKKRIKILALKKVNERIHIPSEKCLVIQTYGTRH